MAFEFIPNAWKIAAKAVSDLVASGDVVLSSLIGAANGVAGTNADGNIIGTVEHRAEPAATLAAITLLNKELAIATDTKELFLGDGVTAGGVLLNRGGVHYRGRAEILTKFTGSEAGSPTFSFPVVTGAIYDITGTLGFSGDTDNLSNALFRFSRASGAVQVLLNPEATELKFFMPSYSWLHQFSVAENVGNIMTPLQDIAGTWAPNVVTLDKPSGVCKFHVRLPILSATAGTYGLKCFLRTDKVVNHTIMASYEIFVSRVK